MKKWFLGLWLVVAVFCAGCGQVNQGYSQENLTQNTVACTAGQSVVVNNQSLTCPDDGQLLIVKNQTNNVVYQGSYYGYYNHIDLIPWWYFWSPYHGGYYYSETHVYHHYTPSTYRTYASKVNTTTATRATRTTAKKISSSRFKVGSTFNTPKAEPKTSSRPSSTSRTTSRTSIRSSYSPSRSYSSRSFSSYRSSGFRSSSRGR